MSQNLNEVCLVLELGLLTTPLSAGEDKSPVQHAQTVTESPRVGKYKALYKHMFYFRWLTVLGCFPIKLM